MTSGFKEKVVEVESKQWALWQKMKQYKGRHLSPVLRKRFSETSNSMYPIKVVVVGDGAVGKVCTTIFILFPFLDNDYLLI